MRHSAEVLIPASVGEAVSAFGDGSGITVIGGATIVMPDLASGRTSVSKALILSRAGLDDIVRDGGTVKIGAATTLEALVGATPDPLSTAAQRIGDYEIRSQATIGGNLCAGPGRDAPRGDLQAPLIALAATVRSAGADGERVQPVEEFLASGPAGRLVLEIEFAEPAHGVYVSMGRPHAHVYTVLSVACAERLPRTPPRGCSTTSNRRTTPSPLPGTGGRPCPSSFPEPWATSERSAHEADRQRLRARSLEPAARIASERPAR
jgi:CO/xanthine dehydrogenase FAD-binding subunit